MKQVTAIYRQRFNQADQTRKNQIWRVLCREFFQQFVKAKKDTVVDMAAGYGEFLNNIKAGQKIAVDLNPDIKRYVAKTTQVIISDCKQIKPLKPNSVEVVFVSNFLEHLNNTDEVLAVLKEAHRILKKGGKVLILQPNIFYVKEAYWFFIDHKTPLTHESLKEALELSGFQVTRMIKQFLPYTTKSALPQSPELVSLYLKLPLLWLCFGKQTFVVAEK